MKSEGIRKRLQKLIINFEQELESDNLRKKVLALIPCFNRLRELGKSLIPANVARSARDRILHYFLKYPQIIIKGNELLVVSGIQEYARRVRGLKIQFGWSIVSGVTAKEMYAENEFPLKNVDPESMGPSDYILLSKRQDRDAAFRWQLANDIRKENVGVHEKLLKYFRANVGKKITGEELKYLAKDRSEWGRRVRELRTEFGWPVMTRNSGRPDLDVGVYGYRSATKLPDNNPESFLASGEKTGKVLVCIGDSITHGRVSHNYLDELENRYRNTDISFVNAGINSQLSYNVLQRIDQVVKCTPDFITILIGTNDASAILNKKNGARYVKNQNLPQAPNRLWYEENLTAIIDILQKKKPRQE